jgi:cytochrome c-type biogenesis protein
MQYLISFLEGIITFISPCLLPMLPVYVSYFAGGTLQNPDNPGSGTRRTLVNAMGFILGFTMVFVALGALAGGLGGLLLKHQAFVNLVTGAVVICFGLNYLGVLKLNCFRGIGGGSMAGRELGFFSALTFGVIFSVGWTPCVGAFLGSALMLASQQGQMMTGILMLLAYSLGLGIPFLASAVLIDQLKSTFNVVKQHYGIINRICGGFLVIMGVLMMTGLMGRVLAVLS